MADKIDLNREHYNALTGQVIQKGKEGCKHDYIEKEDHDSDYCDHWICTKVDCDFEICFEFWS